VGLRARLDTEATGSILLPLAGFKPDLFIRQNWKIPVGLLALNFWNLKMLTASDRMQ
jgi:hypothetical protein